ncbi:hypothetical protein BC937DRAFT_90036 [Endogone sp. FLAS-F59071]|nr:hypothetical protein BC937DRAFT_90036 [Endogone sp. FLAS-F59071]|eukprot:RUS22205.1 hypothetical protein BC937DRAFT_90036 [Endogone sp. FLAS-F59071]
MPIQNSNLFADEAVSGSIRRYVTDVTDRVGERRQNGRARLVGHVVHEPLQPVLERAGGTNVSGLFHWFAAAMSTFLQTQPRLSFSHSTQSDTSPRLAELPPYFLSTLSIVGPTKQPPPSPSLPLPIRRSPTIASSKKMVAEAIDYRVSKIVVLCKDCGQDVGLYPARHKCADVVRPPLPPLPAIPSKFLDDSPSRDRDRDRDRRTDNLSASSRDRDRDPSPSRGRRDPSPPSRSRRDPSPPSRGRNASPLPRDRDRDTAPSAIRSVPKASALASKAAAEPPAPLSTANSTAAAAAAGGGLASKWGRLKKAVEEKEISLDSDGEDDDKQIYFNNIIMDATSAGPSGNKSKWTKVKTKNWREVAYGEKGAYLESD